MLARVKLQYKIEKTKKSDKPAIVSQNQIFKKEKLTEVSVRRAIVESKGNKLQAAKILGIGRAALYRFLDSI
jgi:transcriptional regulator of acetoin/glycerol metabolism